MSEMNQKFCQCCGMPMGDTEERCGTNADGSKNEDLRIIAGTALKTARLRSREQWKK